MKCSRCGVEKEEKEIHESHDVPCYLFYYEKGRKEKKQIADKLGRRYLCQYCHEYYEMNLHQKLVQTAQEYAKKFFEEEKNDSL